MKTMKHKPRLTIAQLEALDQRVASEHRSAIKMGHLILRQGLSLECANCGCSGTVCASESAPGGMVFLGELATSKSCR